MRYLVTGGAGFIGSHLVEQLLQDQNCTVDVWDNLSTGSVRNLNAVWDEPRVTLHRSDVTEIANNRHGPGKFDVIFHLAASPRIQPSFDALRDTVASNVLGTAAIVEYAVKTGSPKLVAVSSSTCDGDPEANPYALTKHHSEEIISMAPKIYSGLWTVAARPYNVYGPRQPKEGSHATLIGIFENQTERGIPLTITGTGEKRRDFTHVSDICRGLLHLAKCSELLGEPGQVFGLGTGKNYSVLEVAEMFQPGEERTHLPSRRGEAAVTLAKNTPPGWKAMNSLDVYVEEFKQSVTSKNDPREPEIA